MNITASLVHVGVSASLVHENVIAPSVALVNVNSPLVVHMNINALHVHVHTMSSVAR